MQTTCVMFEIISRLARRIIGAITESSESDLTPRLTDIRWTTERLMFMRPVEEDKLLAHMNALLVFKSDIVDHKLQQDIQEQVVFAIDAIIDIFKIDVFKAAIAPDATSDTTELSKMSRLLEANFDTIENALQDESALRG